MTNLLLFLCWLAALAALIFRAAPGWLAFAAMAALIVVGTVANRRKAPLSQIARPNAQSQGGQAFAGFGKKQSYDELIEAIRQKSEASRTDGERRLYEGHVFEALFFHQGGFDYYFAHVDDPNRWAFAVGALIWLGRDDVTPIFHEAAKLYTGFDHAADEESTKAYLAEMRELDARFRSAIPDLETRLREYSTKI
jgi:hypothetical protein